MPLKAGQVELMGEEFKKLSSECIWPILRQGRERTYVPYREAP